MDRRDDAATLSVARQTAPATAAANLSDVAWLENTLVNSFPENLIKDSWLKTESPVVFQTSSAPKGRWIILFTNECTQNLFGMTVSSILIGLTIRKIGWEADTDLWTFVQVAKLSRCVARFALGLTPQGMLFSLATEIACAGKMSEPA